MALFCSGASNGGGERPGVELGVNNARAHAAQWEALGCTGEARSPQASLFHYFGGSVSDRLVSGVAAFVSWWTSMLMPMAPRIKSTTAAAAIHMMRISRFSSFWFGIARIPVFGVDRIAEVLAGVNCDNYGRSHEREIDAMDTICA